MHEKLAVSTSTTYITQCPILSTYFCMLFIMYLWQWIQLSLHIGKCQLWQLLKMQITVLQNVSKYANHSADGLIFTSGISVRGNRIGFVGPCFHVSVFLSVIISCQGNRIRSIGLCVSIHRQKDFGAKELYNASCGRCVNAQAF